MMSLQHKNMLLVVSAQLKQVLTSTYVHKLLQQLSCSYNASFVPCLVLAGERPHHIHVLQL
jgi:hypothetical protein